MIVCAHTVGKQKTKKQKHVAHDWYLYKLLDERLHKHYYTGCQAWNIIMISHLHYLFSSESLIWENQPWQCMCVASHAQSSLYYNNNG